MGALYGAIVGLSLGVLEGVVLYVFTLVLRRRGGLPDDVGRYRRTAGWACAAGCVLTFASFWGVIVWRAGDSASVRVAFTRDLPEALIIVAGPSLLAIGAAWWASRRVAGQYTRETGATSHDGETSPVGERPVED